MSNEVMTTFIMVQKGIFQSVDTETLRIIRFGKMKKGILSCVTADVDLEMENQDVYVWKQKKSFIFEHNSREICDRGRGKELRQKHNADLEVPKYLKQKESNISKANKK